MAMAARVRPTPADSVAMARKILKGATVDSAGGESPSSHGGPWEMNLAALASHRPELLELVLSCSGSGRAREDSPADAAGWQDVAAHLETVPPAAQGLAVFLGMGLGHGPLLVLRERPALAQLAIIEPDAAFFCAVLVTQDLRPLIADRRVSFFVGSIDWQALEDSVSRIASLEDTHILRHVPSFRERPALYGPVNDRAYMLLNQLNASGSTTRQCGASYVENRFANLSLLHHSHNLDALRDKFKGKPALLVAAGPSLNNSLAQIKASAGRCVLIAADSALAPLLRAGIVPDFVTSIDYLDLNFEKLAPYLEGEWPFSLVASVKGGAMVAKRFPARHLFFAFTEDYPQRWMMEALETEALPCLFSSVAHLSLGLALILGCDPIVLVGQDLSYTTAMGDHADGTIIMRNDLPKDREIFEIPAVGGGKVPTDRQFLSLLKTFEDTIAATSRRCINASAAGARIGGSEEMSLAEVAARLFREGLPVGEMVDAAVALGTPLRVENFIEVARGQLASAERVLDDLAAAIGLGEKAFAALQGLPGPRSRWREFALLPPSLKEVLSRFDRLNGAVDSVDSLWTPMLELTFGMLSDNDRSRERNTQLGAREGYFPWVMAEIERINEINRQRTVAVETYRTALARLCAHLEGDRGWTEEGGGLEHAALHLAAGDYALARRLLVGLGAAETLADPARLLRVGEARAGMLDFAGANAAWQRALALAPELAGQIGALRGSAMRQWLGFVERYANPGEGGDNFPHLLPTWLQRIMGAAGSREEAAAILRPVFDRHRDRIEGMAEQPELDGIGVVLTAWLPLFEDEPRLLFLLARCHVARGDDAGALVWVERAVAAGPTHREGQLLFIRTLLKAGRFQEAIARLDAAVAVVPSVAILWEEIGDLLLATGDPAGAVIAYEKCFLLLPGRPDSLLRMGHGYRLAGDLPAAVAAYEAFLRRKPDHGEARRWLAIARQQPEGQGEARG